MFFLLDDADVPGLYPIDGYQDIRGMGDPKSPGDPAMAEAWPPEYIGVTGTLGAAPLFSGNSLPT
jgi:hypothetical protein